MTRQPCTIGQVLPVGLKLAIIGVLQFALAGTASADTYTVNSTADTVDAVPGDFVCADAGGFCTLRAAIQEANAFSGSDMISLPAGLYVLTLAGAGENLSATGDLDVNYDLTIGGAGASVTTIDGGSLDRVLHLANQVQLTVSGVTIQHGEIDTEGGGLRADFFGTLIVQNSVITSNVVLENNSQANAGGGVFCGSSTCSLTNTTVSDNEAPNFGGGVAGFFATLNLTDCTVDGNSIAGSAGGGISYGGGGGTIAGTTVSDNHALGGDGGGISAGAAVILQNSTVSGNSASGGGGGVQGDDLTINNSTIAFNSSGPDGDGGGILVQGSGVTVRNSIIAFNTDAGGEAPDCGGIALTSEGYNLIGTATGCTIGGDLTGNLVGVSAALSPLANHGGPTRTHALLGGSPAVHAGNPAVPGSGGTACESVDQRGVSRPQPGGGRCDIGAYEFVANLCANYVVEGAEECDDGNTVLGDCCDAVCQGEPAGTPCAADGNVCTADECDGDGQCGRMPAGCKTAGRSLLLLKNNMNDAKDKLIWKWLKGEETTLEELGTPTGATEYTLCLYAGSESAPVSIPPGSSWQTLGTKGFKFKDGSGLPAGAKKAVLKSGGAGRSKALVKGKGASLPDSLLPMLSLPVTAKLFNDSNGTCFEAVYDSDDVLENDETEFRAKAQ